MECGGEGAQVSDDEQDGIIFDLLIMNIGAGSIGIMSVITFAFCRMQILALSLEFCCLQVLSLRASCTERAVIKSELARLPLPVPLHMWAATVPLPTPTLLEACFLFMVGRKRAPTFTFFQRCQASRAQSPASLCPPWRSPNPTPAAGQLPAAQEGSSLQPTPLSEDGGHHDRCESVAAATALCVCAQGAQLALLWQVLAKGGSSSACRC